MKHALKILFLVLGSFFLIPAQAQIFEPVTWNGVRVGDSVRCTATIEEGWHLTLFSVGAESMFEEIH